MAIASNDGGKQALEAVRTQLPALREPPFGLTTEQVVAIASNDGGKQALEAVRTQLPALREPPFGLTTEQVVAIASNDGGKQALEAVRTQLPALREPPFGLTTEQVVAIASNDGGKQALEAVRTQLPALREPPYGLTTEQVVNMACVVGRPALEAILAYLPALRERFDNERLMTIVSLGGAQALDALQQGRSWAATRQPGRRIRIEDAGPSRAVHMPEPRDIMALLNFFCTHPEPLQAFSDARRQFGLHSQALTRRLALAGVTEMEARAGTIPDAAQRWRRLVDSLNGRAVDNAAASSPADTLQDFAQSLEDSLRSVDAGNPGSETPPAARAKRAAPTAPTTSRDVRPRLDAAPSLTASATQSAWGPRQARTQQTDSVAMPAALSWGTQAPRSQRPARPAQPAAPDRAAHMPTNASDTEDWIGLADPGTPTEADLDPLRLHRFFPGHTGPSQSEASNALMLTNEELCWLDDLFAYPPENP
ncbi:hypothetical protein [Paraburkholderia sp. BR14264]|uniref:hypothetical protein n=1 Tax=Paraburkholderia sp. BR14264 TaxID=3237001 RepID=UPI00397E73BD